MPRAARPGAHEALLDAARDEFARRGVALARVEDVTRRARVSKGAFYLHFRRKEDAFREIVQRFLGALEDHAVRRRELEGALARGGGDLDPAARVAAEGALDADLLEVLWRGRQVLAAVDGASGPRARALQADLRRRLREIVSARIGVLSRGGGLRPEVDPAVAGDALAGAYEGLARRLIGLREKPDLAAWARSLLEVVYRGIAAPPAAGRGAAAAAAATQPDPRVSHSGGRR